MVKKIFFIVSLAAVIYAQDAADTNTTDPLEQKIQSYLCPENYEENKDFIHAIFDPKAPFYKNERVDAVKVIQTLQENGLLHLFFEKPQEIRLDFKTNGSPIFFVKIMSDTLSALGYYKYVTVASTRDASEFVWSINLTAEYATNPLLLQEELQKKSCEIVDIQRTNAKEWSYLIDISHATLNVEQLHDNVPLTLKRFLYEHWLDVSEVKYVDIKSSRRNHWYPYIAYYDSALHLLGVIKKDRISRELSLEIPKNAKYMKISDLYTLKNLKDELNFYPQGAR